MQIKTNLQRPLYIDRPETAAVLHSSSICRKNQKGERVYLLNKNIMAIIMGRAMKMNNEIAFWGHRTEEGRVQPLVEQLRGVSELAGKFADAFGAGGMWKLCQAQYAMRRAGFVLLSSLCL